MSTTAQITSTATWLLEAHDPLAELRHKGTPRPWKQTDLTAEQRAQADAEVLAERADPNLASFPATPAPVHIDILDDLTDQQQTARSTGSSIAATLGDDAMHVQLTRQADTTTTDVIRYIRSAAPRLDPDQHAEVLATTAAKLDQMKTATARHMTEVTEGQRLKTRCPWCAGEQLMVRTIGPDWNPEVVIRCETGVCEPTPGDCGTWHHGMPCWPLHEWEWLARMINWANV